MWLTKIRASLIESLALWLGLVLALYELLTKSVQWLMWLDKNIQS